MLGDKRLEVLLLTGLIYHVCHLPYLIYALHGKKAEKDCEFLILHLFYFIINVIITVRGH